MNFLDGVVNGKSVEVPALKGAFELPMNLPASGTEVTLGIRPEHIKIDASGDLLNVDLSEALGGVSYAYLASEGGEKLIVEERGDHRSEVGARVGISFPVERAMLFDKKSELRLR